ncbi:MAG: hypothetical protein MJ222_02840 [Bacilli bacterium]|nr:hypothetical protein [Bacilli bacterium]
MKQNSKKLLILGGANMHCKLVKAAKEMGIYTIVTDNVKNSPAKGIADKYYDIDINAIDELLDICKTEKISGILASHLDPCQKPYFELCHKLGLPCYIDNIEQLEFLTDKNKFKKLCIETGVDIIDTFELNDASHIQYPVIVKPACNRGSRAQNICYNYAQLQNAIEIAKSASYDGKAIIERFMGPKGDFTVTYFFVNGRPYLERIGDRNPGLIKDHMESVVAGTICPSIYYEKYRATMEPKVLHMLETIHIKNGPVFFQGFIDGDTVRMYDPGFRFPGSEYETTFFNLTGVDLIKMMIEFSMTGKMDNKYCSLKDDYSLLKGKVQMLLFPFVRDGVIGEIRGLEKVVSQSWLNTYSIRNKIGDKIEYTKDVRQQIAEFGILANTRAEMANYIDYIRDNFHVLDVDGNEMIFYILDSSRIIEN